MAFFLLKERIFMLSLSHRFQKGIGILARGIAVANGTLFKRSYI